MIIGIVSSANPRRQFYEGLLPSHTLLYFTPGEILGGISAGCDGFLLDASLLGGERRMLRKLLGQMPGAEVSAFMEGKESHPCVVQHDSAGGVKIQCGRIAAAMARDAGAVGRCGTGRAHTLIFQDVSE